MRDLTIEDFRLLAQQQRDMDAGKVPFFLLDGERVAVSAEVQTALGLVTGQSISLAIFVAIVQAGLRHCQREIALRQRPN